MEQTKKCKVYFHPMKKAIVRKRHPDPKRPETFNDDDDDEIMKVGFRQRFTNIDGQMGSIIRFLFSNAGLVYVCIIYATIGMDSNLIFNSL